MLDGTGATASIDLPVGDSTVGPSHDHGVLLLTLASGTAWRFTPVSRVGSWFKGGADLVDGLARKCL